MPGIKPTIHEFCPKCGALNAFVRGREVIPTGHGSMPGINNPAPRPQPLGKVIFVANWWDASDDGMRQRDKAYQDAEKS